MMIRSLVVAAALWGLLSGVAMAQDSCGCPVIPMQGTYADGATTMDVRHLGSEADACPSALAISGPRRGAPPVDVTLYCQAGSWVGVEFAPRLGDFKWTVSGQQPGPGAGPSVGVRGAESIIVNLGLPQTLHDMGKEDREFRLDLVGAARAPACVCARVREERLFTQDMIATLSDPVLLAAARDMTLRGVDVRGHHYLDANSRLVEFDRASTLPYSFDDIVKLSQAGQSAFSNGTISVVPGAETTQEMIAANGGPNTGVQAGAEASTHPVSCVVSMPPPQEAEMYCTPAVVLDAWRLHEDAHAARCRAINAAPVYLADGKTQLDLNGAAVMIDGLVAPPSPYSAWREAPENIALDEAESYQIEKAVYDAWLGRYCGE